MFTVPSFKHLQEQIRSAGDRDVRNSLRTAHLNIGDLAALLSPAADNHLETMAVRSADITALRFGRTTQIYAPLYVSSFCTNRCSYCGFSADNKIERRILTLDEAEAEAIAELNDEEGSFDKELESLEKDNEIESDLQALKEKIKNE